jgi:aspartyl-tRNA(Asn)/glutamyl-tRNA(Gln) amidotransferase subunit A
MPNEFAFMPALELRRRIAAKEVSPVAVIESTLRHIEAMQPILNPFVTFTGDLALKASREAERKIMAGTHDGLLTGLPLFHQET